MAYDTTGHITELLRHDDEVLRLAVLEAPVPMAIVADDGEIVLLSRAWVELGGYTHADAETIEAWCRHAAPRTHGDLLERIRGLFALDKRVHVGEHTIRARNGEQLVWDFSSAPLSPIHDGRRLIILSAVDVTERKHAEAALRDSERRFRELFENSPDAIFLEALDGRVLDVNPAACDLHGLSRDELIGLNVRELVPPNVREHVERDFARLSSGELSDIESFSWTADQRAVPVEIRVNRVRFGEHNALLLHVRDITRRKEAERKVQELNATLETRVRERTEELTSAYEQLSTANEDLRELGRMKSAFIAVTSHEIRAPLTIVAGMLDILNEKARRRHPDDLRYILPATQATRRLQRIVDRSIETLRSGRYAGSTELAPVAVRELVQAAVDEVEPFVVLRQQALVVSVPPDVPLAHMDRAKIMDVLLNLLMNAIKFTPDGGEVGLYVDQPARDRVRFTVTDTGQGIKPEDRPHIFKEFFTTLNVEYHSSGEYEFEKRGIGLGLSIVKRFVEMHGGTVGVETTPERGSRFWFMLPLQPVES